MRFHAFSKYQITEVFSYKFVFILLWTKRRHFFR